MGYRITANIPDTDDVKIKNFLYEVKAQMNAALDDIYRQLHERNDLNGRTE